MSDLQSSTSAPDEPGRDDDPSVQRSGYAKDSVKKAVTVAVAEGEGMGREITAAVRAILEAAGARVVFDPVAIGLADPAIGDGLPASTWDAIRRHRVVLLGPTVPAEDGPASPSDLLCRALGLFASVRPIRAWPKATGGAAIPATDLVILSDEAASIRAEARLTPEVVQCGRLVTAPHLEQLVRYAFDLAMARSQTRDRPRVHCVVEPGAGALVTGQLGGLFERLAAEHPEVVAEVLTADQAAAQLIEHPQRFGVIIAPGSAGITLARIAQQLSGSSGGHAVARIGDRFAVFEPAPGQAGRDAADPSGMLSAAIEMLRYIGDRSTAEIIDQAWRAALADGLRADRAHRGRRGGRTLGSEALVSAVIERLGRAGDSRPAGTPALPRPAPDAWRRAPRRPDKVLLGVDVYVDWDTRDRNPGVLGKRVEALAAGTGFELVFIANRGIEVVSGKVGSEELRPGKAGRGDGRFNGGPEGDPIGTLPIDGPAFPCSDHWHCRFLTPDETSCGHDDVLALLARLDAAGLDITQTLSLYAYDGQPGFSPSPQAIDDRGEQAR